MKIEQATGTKMLFTPHFYTPSMNTSAFSKPII